MDLRRRRFPVSERHAKLELFGESVRAQAASFDDRAILTWFERHAPWVDPLWVEGTITAATVNDRARRHYPEPPDLLYRQANGAWERYDSARHGSWLKTGTPAPESEESLDRFVVFRDDQIRFAWRNRRAG
jgi:hypothetical protein